MKWIRRQPSPDASKSSRGRARGRPLRRLDTELRRLRTRLLPPDVHLAPTRGLGWVYFKTTTEEIELIARRPDPEGWSDPFFLDSESLWVPATCVGARHAPAPLAALVGATVIGI